jgi:phenylacetate-CoA ligase
MWSGGVTDYLGLEASGATGVPFGVGNTSSLLQLLRPLKITSISATPSYMLVLARRCREELGVDPSELGLRKGYFGGEGILQVPEVRERIEREFGMLAIDANYGMSEVLSVIGGEDLSRDGLIWHAHGILYPELMDTAGKPISIEAGARGEFVFSTLRREAQPLFRYRTNDLAEILWAERADDGLLRFRFKIIGRTDEMLVVRGVNFFPQSLLSLLPLQGEEVSGFYRVVRPKHADVEAVTVLLESHIENPAHLAALSEAIQDKASRLLQVRIAIKWLAAGTIPRDVSKTRFLIDDESEISRDSGR